MTNIFNLTIGSRATIIGYSSNSSFSERLKEFGLIPGTIFTLIRQAPLGGPIEIKYGESRIALRTDSNNTILVEPLIP